MIDNTKEYILCSAIKRKEPREGRHKCLSYKHPSCWEKYGQIDDINLIEIGRRHDLMHMYPKEHLDHSQQGFYTSYGRFVDRQEAMIIAENAGQINRDCLSQGSTSITLFSEDIY